MQEVAKNPSQSGHRVHPRGRSVVGRDVVPSPYSKWLSDALERIHSPSSFHHNDSDSAALRTYVGSASENRSIQAATFKLRPHTDRADPELFTSHISICSISFFGTLSEPVIFSTGDITKTRVCPSNECRATESLKPRYTTYCSAPQL